MTFSTSDLLTGVAKYLAAQHVGTYKTTRPYYSTEVGIVIGPAPQAPKSIIGLSSYEVESDFTHSDSTIGVQFLCRAESLLSAYDLQDSVFDVFQGKANFTLNNNSIQVVKSQHVSSASLGQDEAGLWLTTSNYYFFVHRPSTYRY